MNPMTTYAARMTVDKNTWREVEPAFSELFEAIVVKPETENNPQSRETVMLIFEHEPQQAQLQAMFKAVFGDMPVPAFAIEALPDIDWLQHVYEQLPPIEAGRFFVHGAHVKDIPQDKVALVIEAAAAFGTGEHPTTKGCLMLFDRYLDSGHAAGSVLDMGCGSGILAIAAARLMPQARPIVGIDIDPVSVRVAHEHAADNGAAERIEFSAGNGFHAAALKDAPSFELVFANILAQPLIEMAPSMAGVSPKDVILSGFTEIQKPYVMKAYAPLGFVEHDTIIIGEWVAVWLKRHA